jgi:hypothetical protein
MKSLFRSFASTLFLASFLCFIVSAGCKKDSKAENEDPITNKDIILGFNLAYRNMGRLNTFRNITFCQYKNQDRY